MSVTFYVTALLFGSERGLFSNAKMTGVTVLKTVPPHWASYKTRRSTVIYVVMFKVMVKSETKMVSLFAICHLLLYV